MKDYIKKNKFYVYSSVLAMTITVVQVLRFLVTSEYKGCFIPGIFFFTYPFVFFILKEKNFPIYYLIYAMINVLIIAVIKTYLFNNYTGILIATISILMKPSFKNAAVICYFIFASITFMITSEEIFMFIIHMLKSLWYFSFISHYMQKNYSRKILDLTEQEKDILNQLTNGKLQKEVIGYSENTVCRKIRKACERNGLSKDELKLLYREGNFL